MDVIDSYSYDGVGFVSSFLNMLNGMSSILLYENCP